MFEYISRNLNRAGVKGVLFFTLGVQILLGCTFVTDEDLEYPPAPKFIRQRNLVVQTNQQGSDSDMLYELEEDVWESIRWIQAIPTKPTVPVVFNFEDIAYYYNENPDLPLEEQYRLVETVIKENKEKRLKVNPFLKEELDQKLQIPKKIYFHIYRESEVDLKELDHPILLKLTASGESYVEILLEDTLLKQNIGEWKLFIPSSKARRNNNTYAKRKLMLIYEILQQITGGEIHRIFIQKKEKLDIFLNGSLVSQDSFLIPEGDYRVSLAKKEKIYDIGHVKINKTGYLRVSWDMVQEEKRVRPIRIENKEGAEVSIFLNGKYQGKTPQVVDFQIGENSLELFQEGFLLEQKNFSVQEVQTMPSTYTVSMKAVDKSVYAKIDQVSKWKAGMFFSSLISLSAYFFTKDSYDLYREQLASGADYPWLNNRRDQFLILSSGFLGAAITLLTSATVMQAYEYRLKKSNPDALWGQSIISTLEEEDSQESKTPPSS